LRLNRGGRLNAEAQRQRRLATCDTAGKAACATKKRCRFAEQIPSFCPHLSAQSVSWGFEGDSELLPYR
jgi:hypothetical protein